MIEAKQPKPWRVIQTAMTDSDRFYPVCTAVRLMEMRGIPKSAECIHLHCGPTMGAYLKPPLDAVFGRKAFRNEIAWCCRKWSVSAGRSVRNQDTVPFHGCGGHTFKPQFINPSPGTMKRWKGGKQRAVCGQGLRLATSSDEKARSPCPDWWEISVLDPNARERTGYPTQKPPAMLRRIIAAGSNPVDTVLDPFCGCATACIATRRLGRRWVGTDISCKPPRTLREWAARDALDGGGKRPLRTSCSKIERAVQRLETGASMSEPFRQPPLRRILRGARVSVSRPTVTWIILPGAGQASSFGVAAVVQSEPGACHRRICRLKEPGCASLISRSYPALPAPGEIACPAVP